MMLEGPHEIRFHTRWRARIGYTLLGMGIAYAWSTVSIREPEVAVVPKLEPIALDAAQLAKLARIRAYEDAITNGDGEKRAWPAFVIWSNDPGSSVKANDAAYMILKTETPDPFWCYQLCKIARGVRSPEYVKEVKDTLELFRRTFEVNQ